MFKSKLSSMHSGIMALVISAALFISMPFIALAQNPSGAVSGVVADESGPLAGGICIGQRNS